MALSGYGLLVGKIVAARPQRSGAPHMLLVVQPGIAGHPPYRVAVTLESSDERTSSLIQYQTVDLAKTAPKLVKQLRALGQTPSFQTAATTPNLPALDFVRGGVIDPKAFKPVPAGASPFRDAFTKALAKATGPKTDTLVCVFGCGAPLDANGNPPSAGYQSIHNVHMNQGSRHVTGGTRHFLENGPNQDGGIILLSDGQALGFFCKFTTQTVNTDASGQPADTGIAELDTTDPAVKKAIMPAPAKSPRPSPAPTKPAKLDLKAPAKSVAPKAATRAPAPAVAATAAGASSPAPATAGGPFIFADPDPNDPSSAAFVADDDSTTYKAPFVVKQSGGSVRGPVPTPRRYPTLSLDDIVTNTPGYAKTAAGETIAFDLVGDSGATSMQKLPGELSVTGLMTRDAATAPPAFLFHLGDVVYFYGEKSYYYSQFYEPFQRYPAPIFAIPGNHDAITYDPTMISLDSFQAAFCATAAGRWDGAAGASRSTMTQPGVYFTLDAPLVSIIGLYSNCGESLGWLDDQQLVFFYNELVRLKAARAKDGRAVILAIHHCPRWFPGEAKPDATSTALDAACQKADFWPDAVACGHAHLYQRVVRTIGNRQIPYLIAGAGGYGLNPEQVTAKNFITTLPQGQSRVLIEEGYLRATVTKPPGKPGTLRFEYRSVKQTTPEPDDTWTVQLT